MAKLTLATWYYDYFLELRRYNGSCSGTFFGESCAELAAIISKTSPALVVGTIDSAPLVLGVNGSVALKIDTSHNTRCYGDVRSDGKFNCNGTNGVSGTLTFDDGVSWRITMTFNGGILTAVTTGSPITLTASWA